MAIDQSDYRTALGCFATGVTVVTALGPRGEHLGITVNSFNSVSLDPPLVLWSLGRQAFSLKAFLSTDHFVVNVLREGQEHLSGRFARTLEDKWSGIDYVTWDSDCPVLPESVACFECRTRHTYRGGDHVIFVGEVINLTYDPSGRPLIFHHGRYRSLEQAPAPAPAPAPIGDER